MSAGAINRLLRRRRGHLAAFAVTLALGGAVAAHHMPFEHTGMGGAMVLCLAVLPVLALAASRAVEALLPRARRPLAMVYAPCRLRATAPLPRARSSPVATVVLRC
jgi:hypothetical protein